MDGVEVRGLSESIDVIGGFSFYDEIPVAEHAFQAGQFFSGHIIYPLDISPKVLEIEHYDIDNENNSLFKISEFDSQSESQSMRPIKTLNLGARDRIYLLKGKIRTAILLKIIDRIWIDGSIVQYAICLPTATFKKEHHSTQFIVNIQLFNHPQHFYIKPCTRGSNQECSVRFDLMQIVPLSYLRPIRNEENNRKFMISASIMKLMLNQLSKLFFNKPIDEDLESEICAYRDLMMGNEGIKKLLGVR